MAVTLAGIVWGVAAQKRSEALLAEVAHKTYSFPADMSGGQKQRLLSSGESIMHREAGRILGEERNVLTAPNETSSLAEVPSAGRPLRTRLRAQRNRARFRGCRRTRARRGGFPKRRTQGLSGKELPPAPMNGVIVRKLRHPGESAPFDSRSWRWPMIHYSGCDSMWATGWHEETLEGQRIEMLPISWH